MSAHQTKPNTQQIDNAITCIKQDIKRLSQSVSKDITPQQVEDLHDDVIDSLNSALSRLGVDRYAE